MERLEKFAADEIDDDDEDADGHGKSSYGVDFAVVDDDESMSISDTSSSESDSDESVIEGGQYISKKQSKASTRFASRRPSDTLVNILLVKYSICLHVT